LAEGSYHYNARIAYSFDRHDLILIHKSKFLMGTNILVLEPIGPIIIINRLNFLFPGSPYSFHSLGCLWKSNYGLKSFRVHFYERPGLKHQFAKLESVNIFPGIISSFV
jgi:hypothetical protein